ncbi:hypothetical protein [Streptomyces xanthochromogenes]|uniref:hypothetical protein n=1 Tax=Streptomyces xanthochromogenes TaxID=67384 RepID=UPI002F42EECE
MATNCRKSLEQWELMQSEARVRDSTVLLEFARTGQLGFLALGASAQEVEDGMGKPSGVADSAARMAAYSDVQLGQSPSGIVGLISVEPDPFTGLVVLPPPLGSGMQTPAPGLEVFRAYLGRQGLGLESRELYTPGEFWWVVPGSEVSMAFDEQGELQTIASSDRDLLAW